MMYSAIWRTSTTSDSSRRRIMASTASMSAAMRLRRSSGCKGGLSHCGIDSTAGEGNSIFFFTTPAKGMYNFVFFQRGSELSMYAVVITGGKQDRVFARGELERQETPAALGR